MKICLDFHTLFKSELKDRIKRGQSNMKQKKTDLQSLLSALVWEGVSHELF